MSIAANIEKVIHGQKNNLRKIIAAFASGGHVLLEDSPGTGKTTLAKSLARSVDSTFSRVQFTPDLLPTDILGVSVFNQKSQEFQFHPGPIFTQILLADEINRASPRTQSALLEAMAEHQVSVENSRHDLGPFFFVIATQNPIETQGTYPLPEAQMDRFAIKTSLGYVAPEVEVEILSRQQKVHPLDDLKPCATKAQLENLRAFCQEVTVSQGLKKYIVDLVQHTRTAQGIKLGASPRASLALMKTAQALAVIENRDFVIPEDIQELAVSVLAHRLSLDPQARFGGLTQEFVVADVVRSVKVPV